MHSPYIKLITKREQFTECGLMAADGRKVANDAAGRCWLVMLAGAVVDGGKYFFKKNDRVLVC